MTLIIVLKSYDLIYCSFLDLSNVIKNRYLKKSWLTLLLRTLIFMFSLGCVILQTKICLLKFLSSPVGSDLEIVNTKDISISFTMCIGFLYRLGVLLK